jgi:hypothetical protein
MADLLLSAVVQADGQLVIDGKVDFPPGTRVQVMLWREPVSVTLEEAKRRLATIRELTPEEEAEFHRLYAQLDAAAVDNLGFPEDYIDELDHYLYGAPKRSAALDEG